MCKELVDCQSCQNPGPDDCPQVIILEERESAKMQNIHVVDEGIVFTATVTQDGAISSFVNGDDLSLRGEKCHVYKGKTFSVYEGGHWERGDRDEDTLIPGHLEGGEYVTFDLADAERVAAEQRQAMKPVAVLSTTVLPLDGTYRVETVNPVKVDIAGVPHYIGHPATKEIIEKLGAVQAESKLFTGLQPGESAVCFAIAQGKSTRAQDGFTSPHQDITQADLTCRVIRRIR